MDVIYKFLHVYPGSFELFLSLSAAAVGIPLITQPNSVKNFEMFIVYMDLHIESSLICCPVF